MAIPGAKDRNTNRVKAKVVPNTKATTLQAFAIASAVAGAIVYSDDASAYKGIPFDHEAVRHSVGEFVRQQAHINGLESFWATLKRGYHGTHHHLSPKHPQRYVAEFAGRHNIRGRDTLDQRGAVAGAMAGKRLICADMTA